MVDKLKINLMCVSHVSVFPASLKAGAIFHSIISAAAEVI